MLGFIKICTSCYYRIKTKIEHDNLETVWWHITQAQDIYFTFLLISVLLLIILFIADLQAKLKFLLSYFIVFILTLTQYWIKMLSWLLS